MKTTRSSVAVFAALSLVSLGGCTEYSDRSANAAPPPESPYYADQYYREGPNYEERRLSDSDLIYQGRDGRYYCKRNDGTTGLIVGGIAGGVLGNLIAPGGSKTLGTLLGAAGGAAVGTSIDKDNVRCR
jgi:hypothetical protein